jgi:hypothetical protein
VKIKVKALKRLIENMLLEEENTDEMPQEEGDSVDSQIDAKLTQFESDSSTSSVKEEDDVGVEKKTQEDINVESFATDVVRLVENFENLIEFKNVVMRRAKNFLKKVYSQEVIKLFEDEMKKQGFAISKSSLDIADEDFPAPDAERSGASAGGGAPGV